MITWRVWIWIVLLGCMPLKHNHIVILHVSYKLSIHDQACSLAEVSYVPYLLGLIVKLSCMKRGVYCVRGAYTHWGFLINLLQAKLVRFKVNLPVGANCMLIQSKLSRAPGLVMFKLDREVGKLSEGIGELSEGIGELSRGVGKLSGDVGIVVNSQKISLMLLADTYIYHYFDTAEMILYRAEERLRKVLQIAYEQYKRNALRYVNGQIIIKNPLKTPEDLLILTSLVVKEGIEREYEQIARVFLHRLVRGMRLQSCVTLGLRDDLNTYRRYGLPSEPVSIVSKEALLAVASVRQLDDKLYFVAKRGCNEHVFSSTFKQHVEAKKGRG